MNYSYGEFWPVLGDFAALCTFDAVGGYNDSEHVVAAVDDVADADYHSAAVGTGASLLETGLLVPSSVAVHSRMFQTD